MATPKQSEAEVRIRHFLAPHRSNLRDDLQTPEAFEAIVSGMITALHDSIACADTEETAQAYIDTHFDQYKKHWLKVAVAIPETMASAAFLDGTAASRITAQGILAKRFGAEAVKVEAQRWGTTLGSGKAGRNPNNGDTGESKKPIRDESAAPNKNPWHPRWNGKDRTAAQISIIKGLGTKKAAELARSCGLSITGQPLKK
jgi:hypothetical protein